MRHTIMTVLFTLFAILNTSFANNNWQEHLESILPSVNISEKLERELNPFYKPGSTPMNMDDAAMRLRINQVNTEYLAKLEQDRKETTIIAQDKKRKGVDRYSDLSNKYITINADKMNQIIDVWESRNGYLTPFHGQGRIFIKASKKSGLDPLYIFAHAVVESGWGTSHYATNRGNYFGINAVDHNPDKAYTMGDNMEDGIINGAIWINDNFYKEGAYSLNTMVNGSKKYATDSRWVNKIEHIWNESYAIMFNK